MKTWMLAALLGLGGCATTRLQPPAQHFSGDPYEVTMHHGVIAGEVCGRDVDYGVYHAGGAIELLGRSASRLEVHELGGGAVEVTGMLNAGVTGEPEVALRVSPDAIVGHIFGRVLRLTADGDGYRGTYAFPEILQGDKTNDIGDIEIAGRDEMLRLPHATLAALLPGLLTCDRRAWTPGPPVLFHPPIAARFGGPAHYETTAAR